MASINLDFFLPPTILGFTSLDYQELKQTCSMKVHSSFIGENEMYYPELV